MRSFVLVVLAAGCAVEEPPCGEREELSVLVTDAWCPEDYTPERMCCAGDVCVVQARYDAETLLLNDDNAEPAELECGTEDQCLQWIVDVEAWCEWEASDDYGKAEPPPFPERIEN